MKKLFFVSITLSLFLQVFSQSQGISYQAVIIDKNTEELPGVNINRNILVNHELLVRFSILDSVGTIEYQETHSTSTDEYGMINLTIGKGSPTNISPNLFEGIDWSGFPKSLKVDISLSTKEVFFTDFSFQDLNFIPYAYHKNITATGTLSVNGVTSLNSRLNVTNGSATFLSGNLAVYQSTVLKKDLTVDSVSNLKGQVTIHASVSGDNSNYNSYPLRIEGSTQGIGVKINGSRSGSNNFVTFWDSLGVQGSIQGQTTDELLTNPDYIFNNIVFANTLLTATTSEVQSIVDLVGASTSTTPCAGLGICETAPVPSLIVAAAANVIVQSANLAVAIAQPILYNVEQIQQIGVTYSSGAGDYAEWLPKLNVNDEFFPGEIVGVHGGKISRSTENAGSYMVISLNPIVLGNVPETENTVRYEKVAFMGQVPVKVYGKVQTGDYILPDGKNDGAGIAVSPGNMEAGQYAQIVGIAWSPAASDQYNYIKVAVGLNANDIAKLSIKHEQKIKDQQAEIDNLKDQMSKMNKALTQLVPGFSNSITADQAKSAKSENIETSQVQTNYKKNNVATYFEVTKDQILAGYELAKKSLVEKGVNIESHPFFKKMENEPGFKEKYINDLQNSIRMKLDENFKTDLNTGSK